MSRVVVVVDNTPGRDGLVGEHGLSLWLEHAGNHLLLDTGAGRALMPNLAALDLDPAALDGVVLSHGHYDHTGGLLDLLRARDQRGLGTPVWCHPAAFGCHLKAQEGGGALDVGCPVGPRRVFEDLGARFHWVEGAARPWTGITLLAPILRVTAFEGPAPGLVTRRGEELIPDPLEDDLALVVEALGGPAVLTGCAHSGVINLLMAAEAAVGDRPTRLVGGTHLGPAPPDQQEAALAELAARPELRLAAGHCTGQGFYHRLAQALGDRAQPLASGLILEL